MPWMVSDTVSTVYHTVHTWFFCIGCEYHMWLLYSNVVYLFSTAVWCPCTYLVAYSFISFLLLPMISCVLLLTFADCFLTLFVVLKPQMSISLLEGMSHKVGIGLFAQGSRSVGLLWRHEWSWNAWCGLFMFCLMLGQCLWRLGYLPSVFGLPCESDPVLLVSG